MTLTLGELWRYPVKSLAGERLAESMLTTDGVPGDRLVHVRGPEGVRTARRHHRLLGLRGTLSPEGVALIDGHRWDSEAALERVRRAAGQDAWLQASDSPDRFDILPLLVATDGAIRAFGRDVRRLRPNLVISGVDGLAERAWEEAGLAIGDAAIYLDSLRGRCPMTTVDPDTLERDPEMLKDIGRRFGGRLALNAMVLRAGHVKVGNGVRLLVDGEMG